MTPQKSTALDIATLSRGVVYKARDGVSHLAIRPSVVIPYYSDDFAIYELPRPYKLSEVSTQLYGDWSMWALLGEWNTLPNAAQYLYTTLPTGTRVRYLTVEKLRTFLSRTTRPTLSGIGEYDYTVALPSTAPAPVAPLEDGLAAYLTALEAAQLTFIQLGAF